nr:DUF3188 domain-containing protein [Psychromicrobium silvestre]
MAALAIGLVLTIIGANIGNSGVMWTGMPFLGLGMLLHVIGIGVRGRAVSRRLKDAHAKQSQTGSN